MMFTTTFWPGKKCLFLMVFFIGLNIICFSDVVDGQPNELTVVEKVDLSRYLGKWFEIAHIPVWFQKGCIGGTTAEYTLFKEGFVNVVNRCCDEEGEVKEAKGRAWIVDQKHPVGVQRSVPVWLLSRRQPIMQMSLLTLEYTSGVRLEQLLACTK